MSGSERGRWKSVGKGNSLAAYSTASVVRGGAVGKGLCYSTSLAAYSTLAARALISSAAAS